MFFVTDKLAQHILGDGYTTIQKQLFHVAYSKLSFSIMGFATLQAALMAVDSNRTMSRYVGKAKALSDEIRTSPLIKKQMLALARKHCGATLEDQQKVAEIFLDPDYTW